MLLFLIIGAVAALPVATLEHPENVASPALIEASVLAATDGQDTGLTDRLSTSLVDVVQATESRQLQGIAGPEKREYVYVYLRPGQPTSLLDGHVAEIVNRDERYGLVTAWVTSSELRVIASLEGVHKVREVDPPVFGGGRCTTEGDALLKTDEIRRLHNCTGAGVKVGVISDGVDGLADAQQGGDLPATVHVLDTPTGTAVAAEGTAMLEIIHDVAPGAELYFHTAGDDVLAFNHAVDELVAQGCMVIVDDVGWVREPYFEDGVVARHVAGVIAANHIVYVSAAGNNAEEHYQGYFHDGGNGFHDFSGTGSDHPGLYARLSPGDYLVVVLQWSEPFGEASTDFNLYLVDAETGELVSSSVDRQDGDDDPLERVQVKHTGSASTGDAVVEVVVRSASGSGAEGILEVNLFGAPVYRDNVVPADSVWGHAAVDDAIATGAIGAGKPDLIEDYSSNGPVTLLYPRPTVREKPDVCGIDDVMVSGAGGFDNRFQGTSAAAPHIAGLCALIWSANPGLSGDAVRDALCRSAVDLGAPGYDLVYGWGRADASAMYNLAAASSPRQDSTYEAARAYYESGSTAWAQAWRASDVTLIRQYLKQARTEYTNCLNATTGVRDPANAANVALITTISTAYIDLADAALAMYDGSDTYGTGRSRMNAGGFASAASSFQSAATQFGASTRLFDRASTTLQSASYAGTEYGDGTAYTATIVPILTSKAAYIGEFATYAQGWQHTALAYQARTSGDQAAFQAEATQAMNLFAGLRSSAAFGADAANNYNILAAQVGTITPVPTTTMPTPTTPTPTPTATKVPIQLPTKPVTAPVTVPTVPKFTVPSGAPIPITPA